MGYFLLPPPVSVKEETLKTPEVLVEYHFLLSVHPSIDQLSYNLNCSRILLLLSSHLFLSRSLLSLLGGALGPDTDKSGLGAGVTELPVDGALGLEVGDLALLDLDLVGDWQSSVGKLDVALVAGLLGGLDVLGGSISLGWLLAVAWEEDDTAAVGLQALDVGGQ